jgi:hypothetical protein
MRLLLEVETGNLQLQREVAFVKRRDADGLV